MKRFVSSTALAAVLTAGAFAGSASAQEKIRIYFNPGHGYDTYMQAIAEFEEANPGFEVAFERYQWGDLRTKLIADFAVGNPPDLAAEPGQWVTEFAEQGLLTNLDEFIARDQAEFDYPADWQDSTVSKNSVDGSTYGIQMHLTCINLVYNKDMLAEAGFDGPPANWDEFREIAKATTKRGVFGFAPNSDPFYVWPFMLQAGGKLYDEATGEIVLDSEANASGLQLLTDMIHEDRTAALPAGGSGYEGPQKLFTAGRAAMILTGPWDASAINTGNPDLNWGVAPSLTKEMQATTQGGVSLIIPKDAKHPEQAWDLLKRLTAVDVEIATSQQYGMTMPRKSWLENAEVQQNETLAGFGECLAYSQDVSLEMRKAGAYDASYESLVRAAVEESLFSADPATESLARAAEEIDKTASSGN